MFFWFIGKFEVAMVYVCALLRYVLTLRVVRKFFHTPQHVKKKPFLAQEKKQKWTRSPT